MLHLTTVPIGDTKFIDTADEATKTSLQIAEGDPRVKNMGPPSQAESTSFDNRTVESKVTTTIEVTLSTGESIKTGMAIQEFLKDFQDLPYLSLITNIAIHSTAKNNEVQVHKTDLEELLTMLYERNQTLPELKNVSFGDAPQPYIHLKKLPRSEKVLFDGILISGTR